jgi:serine/threonine-protein phosphatase 4 regulatory subunit 1
MATRKELEEMIENLEPHMDDPDVKAQVEVLLAALRAFSLHAHQETSGVEQQSELQDEVRVRDLPGCNINHDTCVPLISAA